jgi:hypothetical protein
MYIIEVLANHTSLSGSLKKGEVLNLDSLPADALLNEKAGFIKIKEEAKKEEAKKTNSK